MHRDFRVTFDNFFIPLNYLETLSHIFIFISLLNTSSIKWESMIESGLEIFDFEPKRSLIELLEEICFRSFCFFSNRFTFSNLFNDRKTFSFLRLYILICIKWYSLDFIYCLIETSSIIDQTSFFLSSYTECIAFETVLDCLTLSQ